MASAQERFQAAVNVIKGLPKNGPYQPSTGMMLKFYGLYKQATEGDCHQRKPAFWDVVNKAKWDAWNRNSHMTKEEAMLKYVESLQEIIETMSFTENVQNFVGSLQGLENINLDELEIIAPGMKELAESHPNSPFHSRTNSPQHSTNGSGEEDATLNGHDSTLDNVTTPPATPVQNTELPTTHSLHNSLTHESTKVDYSQTNGSIDQSDDEYVDPFDIQNELYESLQRNTEILKQVQATVLRMNSDLSSVNQRVFDLEKTIKEMKASVANRKTSGSNVAEPKYKYPKWWPFTDISPVWFVLLILWPFIVRRVGKMLDNPPKRK
ncbi:acyl-CoA-binding domain-containing protein 5 [Lucilia cuprina]|uniref:acyl-CoA-binding domain-containing protein 5 n=1 Tax=Lucilia cuprina TaxID=7375 RepID=UPI001F05A17A|nr:acyl-CoA-binding domain-containing protein 5 [Lucilia cuprina]XP_023291774.2 acyl-CoA-binding domain-containing protein 5 [Lucilia cuprina]XP_023291775.2 acyl-CoA-binding domain-containing protein 5 [Lucilia cuprina]XP_046812569.1 acyl-CoA-binding domain-containing protein 5 [Lucilia cuprina]